MNQNISVQELKDILSKDLEDSRIINDKMEEAYDKIRHMAENPKKSGKKATGAFRRIMIGFSTAAAAVVVALTFCAVNPALAEKIPFIGDLFTRVQDVFPFGQVPEEEAAPLYSGAAAEENMEGGENGENASGADSAYRQSVDGLTITFTDVYASNQAVFVGVCVENEQEFPQLATFAGGYQTLQVKTVENYSFRDNEIISLRDVEGKMEDEHTFIGIMRIDYSDINVDDSGYVEACREAEANHEPIPVVKADADMPDDWFRKCEIPTVFDMDIKINSVIGYLANPITPEGMKSGEELEQMSDEEWENYIKSLPQEWTAFPNSYENWYQEGSWTYALQITKSENDVRTIAINEVNEEGIGVESIEISPVEMTLNPVEPADHPTFAVALDKNGNKISSGSSNAYELAIADHDISTVYIYIFDYDEYMDDIKGYFWDKETDGRSVWEILEERALFKTTVNTAQ